MLKEFRHNYIDWNVNDIISGEEKNIEENDYSLKLSHIISEKILVTHVF